MAAVHRARNERRVLTLRKKSGPVMSDVDHVPESKVTIDQIIQDHGTRIFNLARRMLDNTQDAEDLTQQVLLKVFQKRDHYRGEAALGTWIYSIAVHMALSFRERRRRVPIPLEDPLADFRPDGRHAQAIRPWRDNPLQAVLDNETRQVIEKAITALPESYRDAYLLTDVEELPIPEGANLLHLTVPAFKSRLHRARLLLRKKLAPYFEVAEA